VSANVIWGRGGGEIKRVTKEKGKSMTEKGRGIKGQIEVYRVKKTQMNKNKGGKVQ
jgi:hypothetical protein